MTGTGPNLPEETLKRIEALKEEAYRSEIRDLEARIAAGIGRHLEARKKSLDEKISDPNLERSSTSGKHLAGMRTFEAGILETLRTLALERRSERIKVDGNRRRERMNAGEGEEKAQEENRGKTAAALVDPAVRIRAILRQANGHLARGDMVLASRAVSEGLKLDAFNAELVDLDLKIREARESDAFSAPPGPPAPEKSDKKEKSKGKKEKVPQPKPGAAPAEARPAERIKFPSRLLSSVAAVLILAAAVIAYLVYTQTRPDARMTLAILPWSARGDSPATVVFADALPEIVLNRFARYSFPFDLLGYSTTVNMARISTNPARSLAGLGYSHFLRGSIGGTDSAYNLRVELIDSAETTLWSEDFTRDAAGTILVPIEIAHGLGLYFGSKIPESPVVLQVRDYQAYFLYLEGLESSRQPDGHGLDDAIDSFNRSLALDSTFAESHAGLASALAEKFSLDEGRQDTLLLDVARTAASTAVRLAPELSDGYLAMGRILIEKRLYEDALAMLDSAARLSPRDGRILFLRGLIFFRSGRNDQALQTLERAYRLDPRNPEILRQLAAAFQLEKSFDRALWYQETAMYFSADSSQSLIGPVSDIISLDPALSLSQGRRVTSACLRILERDPRDYPTLYSLARMLQVSGDIQESITYFNSLGTILRASVKTNPSDTRARMYLGLTLTRLGRYDEGLATGEAAAAADPGNVEVKYLLARIYSLQMYSPRTKTVDETKKTKALDLLREALNLRFDNTELGSADFYNVHYQADIRGALSQAAGGDR